jgi:hypothetical protein
MKKLTLSTIATLVLASSAMAGGDIDPIIPSMNVPSVLGASALGGNLYVGAGYTMPFATELSVTGSNSVEAGDSTGMFIMGSDFNEYFGIEARWTPMEGNNDNFAIYAKPQWKMTQNWNIYGLIGAGKTERQDVEFQAGAGLGYDINSNWGVFADFVATDFETELTNFDGSTDTGFSGNASFGVTYNF